MNTQCWNYFCAFLLILRLLLYVQVLFVFLPANRGFFLCGGFCSLFLTFVFVFLSRSFLFFRYRSFTYSALFLDRFSLWA